VISAVAFVTLVGYTLAAYPTQTNNLYNALNTCTVKTQSDIDCITTVRDGLDKLADYIQKVQWSQYIL